MAVTRVLALAVFLGVVLEAQLVDSRSAVNNARMLDSAPTGMFQRKGDHYLYQGDMLLSAEQAVAAMQRKMVDKVLYWPRNEDNVVNINYVLVKGVDTALIRKSLAEWSKRTCVIFSEIDPPSDDSPYMSIEKLDGCYSHLGKRAVDGKHVVSVGDNCGLTGAIHELGHAVGMQHEQCRSDRDKYVKILTKNVDPNNVYNFNKEVTLQYGVPYDYYSMMHYGGMFFSNGGTTIRTLDPMFQSVIGTDTDRLSFMDAKMFNIAYKCIDDWKSMCPDTKCLNGGYVQDIEGDCVCKCPEGTSGGECDTKMSSYNDAILSEYFPDTEKVTSPGKIATKNYPKNPPPRFTMTKYITAPKCKKVVVKFTGFDLTNRSAKGVCNSDHLEVRTDDSPDGGKVYCGDEIKAGQTFESTKSTLIIHYYTYWGQQAGYQADVTFEDIKGCT